MPTTAEELPNDVTVTSPDDVEVTSLEPFQQQQQIAVYVDSGNNVDKVMSGISDNNNNIHGSVYTNLNDRTL